LTLVLLSAGCSIGSGPAPTPLSATGLVIAANGPDSATVNTFTLRTDDGQTLNFTVGTLDLSNGGLPAPHLREHMLGLTPTTVYYRIENGGLIVLKFVDATE
jgi:hypothetical protein